VGLPFLAPQDLVDVQPGIHTGDDGQPLLGRQGEVPFRNPAA
jgi:hypothetical protein